MADDALVATIFIFPLHTGDCWIRAATSNAVPSNTTARVTTNIATYTGIIIVVVAAGRAIVAVSIVTAVTITAVV